MKLSKEQKKKLEDPKYRHAYIMALWDDLQAEIRLRVLYEKTIKKLTRKK